MSTSALRLHTRAWRALLVLGPLLVLAFAFRALWTLRAASERADADDMSVVADRVARLVDAYLGRVTGMTSHIAAVPEVVRLAAERSQRPLDETDRAADRDWRTRAGTEGDPFAAVRAEPLSAFFQDLTGAAGGLYREVFLADARGRLVAASNRTEDFLQADDAWWPADLTHFGASCRLVPMECVRITDVAWDPSASAFGYDVVLPVVTADAGEGPSAKARVVGVLKAVVDPAELQQLLGLAGLDRRLDVALVDSRGMRLLSPKRFFDERDAARLRELARGSEASWPLPGQGDEDRMALVRRLASPIDGGWVVAVAPVEGGGGGVGRAYALWCLFTLGMFVVAAGAFAVRGSRAAPAPPTDTSGGPPGHAP
jgi:hypothetical protein